MPWVSKLSLPLYGSSFLDVADTAWVFIFGLDEPTTRLQAISAGPTPAPILALPRNIRVFDIGGDYILGRYDDDEGEVHLVMYRLRRPGAK